MNKSNKLIVLILIINILIFSIDAYTLKKYDYGQFFQVSNGPQISKIYKVSKDQLLNFKITRDKGDSIAALFSITSKGAPESIIFYSTFSDEIASEKNSNKTSDLTPLGYSLCLPDVFSFSIQMNNYMMGGDLNITIQADSDVSHCHKNSSPVNKESDTIVLYSSSSKEIVLQSDGTMKISGESVVVSDNGDISVGKNIIHENSSASTSFVNGTLLFFSIIILLSHFIY